MNAKDAIYYLLVGSVWVIVGVAIILTVYFVYHIDFWALLVTHLVGLLGVLIVKEVGERVL